MKPTIIMGWPRAHNCCRARDFHEFRFLLLGRKINNLSALFTSRPELIQSTFLLLIENWNSNQRNIRGCSPVKYSFAISKNTQAEIIKAAYLIARLALKIHTLIIFTRAEGTWARCSIVMISKSGRITRNSGGSGKNCWSAVQKRCSSSASCRMHFRARY